MKPIYASTAQFPGLPLIKACERLHLGVDEVFGPVSPDHIQLCPQAPDWLDETRIAQLHKRFPTTQFRIHANLRIQPGTIRIYDASTQGPAADAYFIRLGQLSNQLSAPLYSLHAGRRSEASLEQLKERIAWIQAQFACTVAVEGLYPSRAQTWLIADWQEYRWLLDSSLPYALDLSHLNIVSASYGPPDAVFLKELIASPQCRELHLSDNDGIGDSHWLLQEHPWWWELFISTPTEADCFTEGRQPVPVRSGQKLTA